MRIILLIFFLGATSAQVSINDEWKEVKSPLDSPRHHEIIEESSPTVSTKVNRVAGGELARLGQFVHQVLLLNVDSLGDSYICGGSIISRSWILTAAHCLDDIVKISVYAGVVNRRGPALWNITVYYDKAFIIVHENFTASKNINDIGLIQLPILIIDDPRVGIISLPSRSEVLTSLEGKMATIAGFERYTDSSSPSQQLRFVQNKISSNAVCEKFYEPVKILQSHLCLEGSNGRSSCQSDSGGGLHLELNGRKVVLGIVSFGKGTCTLNHPKVYTRVSSYLDWIKSKTEIKID